MFENSLYSGIVEVLKYLVHLGVKLYIATSMPEFFAKKIIDYFNLTTYFSGVYGSKLDGELSDKGKLINHILIKENIPCNNVLMIGDRKHDIIGANKNSIDSLGVDYGYSKGEELRNAGATYIVRDIDNLKEFFTMDIYA